MAETPTFEKVVQQAIQIAVAELRVSLPAYVERYDAQKQQADVQPAIMKKYGTGEVVKLPIIPNVPVVHPRAGTAMVHLPIKKGDVVQLVFSDRSLDRWLSEGGVVDPLEGRKHHLSDAVAYPGGYPFSDPVPITDPDAITITGAVIRIGEQGAATHPAARGDNVEARLSALESGLSQIVTDFTTFITSYSAHTHLESLPPATPTSPPVVPGIPPTPFVADTSVVESEKVKVD